MRPLCWLSAEYDEAKLLVIRLSMKLKNRDRQKYEQQDKQTYRQTETVLRMAQPGKLSARFVQ